MDSRSGPKQSPSARSWIVTTQSAPKNMLICSSLMAPGPSSPGVRSRRMVRMTTNTCLSKRSTFGRCGTLSTSSRASGCSPSRSPRRATSVGSPRPSMLIQVTALCPRRPNASSSVATFCVSPRARSNVVTSIVGISAEAPATSVPGGTPGWMRAVRPRWGRSGRRARPDRDRGLMRSFMLREPRRYVKIEGVTSMPSRGLALAVAVLTCLVFVPVLGGGFLNWDDDRSLLTNDGFRGVGLAQLRWMFTTTLLGHYAPLTWLSFGVTYAIAGMAPGAYHFGNLALHALNAVLVYRLAERLLTLACPMTAPLALRAGALVAALAFAVHPLRVESVGWITDRGDVLCASFYLLATLAYVRFALAEDAGTRHRWRLASLGALAAALLSTEIAMTLPLSLLLLDAYPLRREARGLRALLVEKIPWVALAGAGAALAVFARGHGAGWTSYAEHGLVVRLALAAYSLAFYPLKFVWPSDLSPLYELPARVSPLQARFVVAALAVLAVSALLVVLRQQLPGVLGAWLHAAVAVAPVSGLVHAGSQLVADRYSYLPGIGFAVVAGGVITAAVDARRRGRLAAGVTATAAAVTTIGLIIFGTLSWQHAWHWRSSVSLWRWAVAADEACML